MNKAHNNFERLNNPQDLIARAKSVLKTNNRGSYIIPSKGLYPHQVLWDSCFIAIGLSHYDIRQAQSEITRLFDAQWSNGMIPHIVFTTGPNYWLDRRIWRSWISPLASRKIASSGISQPPMIAEAVVRIGQQLSQEQRIIWYQSVFSQLVAYHSWLYKERDPNRDGLVVQLHPWETGLDNSPPCMVELRNKNLPWWLRFLEISHLDNIGNYFRTDYNYVSKGERSSNIEALSLYNLLTKIRRKKYDSQAILRDPAFAIEDITYNSILIRANALLSEIAEVIHQKLPEQLIKSISQAASALENLWDNDNHQYFSRQFISGRLIKQPSIGSLLALYSGAISHQRAGQLVKIIEDNQSYGLEFPLPTVPTISSWFNPNQYWQGPTWVNTNWLIIDGLKRYGFHDQANSLTMTTLCLVEKSGFYEYFNPISGVARGVNNFSWTAALTIDLIQNTGLVG